MPSLRLTDHGTAQAVILLPSAAHVAERHAAEQLQDYFSRASGVMLPIETVEREDTAVIHVGRSSRVDQLIGDFQWKKLGSDGILLQTVDRHVVLAGFTPRGTLYAVYEFLERILGCRWPAPGAAVVPACPVVDVPELRYLHVPAMVYREPYAYGLTDPEWAVANRANGAIQKLDEHHGGRWEYAGAFVHNFFGLVSPDDYFESHPEYFSEIDGIRRATMGQLCLTNPDVLDLATETCRRTLQRHPDARVMTLSQMDWGGWCTCPACRRVDEEEGSPSATILSFVNAVAGRLESEFPAVAFDTLAYTYSIRPPRTIRPRSNVIIRLCNINACDSHAMTVCDRNRGFVQTLKQWAEIAHTLFVWDYHNNFSFYFQPYPNLDRIIADIPFLAAHKVRGYFAQLDASPSRGSGDMVELRGYLISRLLWDPGRDGWAIIDEFCRSYYGAAADPVRAYLDHLQQYPRQHADGHATLYQPLVQPAFTPEWIRRANCLFDDAEQLVAEDEVLLERVRTARLPVDYLSCKPNLGFRISDSTLEADDPAAREQVRRFLTRAGAHGAGALRESGPPLECEQRHLDPYDVITLSGEGIKVRIAPEIGGRIVSLLDRDGREWLRLPRPLDGDTPVAGGYEEYSESRWRTPGWSEPYEMRQHASQILLSADLRNGLRFERGYRLQTQPDGNSSLQIESSLTNPGDATVEAVLRTHPVFDPVQWDATTIRVPAANGANIELAPWRVSDETAGSVWLTREELAAGCWSLQRGARVLTMRFDPAPVEKVLLDWSRREDCISMELFASPVRLAAGHSIVVRQTWRFTD